MKSVIVGTAGHIDHGKSSLVKALTGTDPDRWEEERRRGITIDIGFAHLETPGVHLAFVDVPGHERFVKNMLAGIGGIDLVLFVVAADESIKPQTREHFDICRLLAVKKGLVALTKCDLVDPDIRELVKLEIEEFVAGSFLDGAPILPVSAKTREGLDALVAELCRLAAEVSAKDSMRPFRLPIDRAFIMKGFGTVVTGTLISGSVKKEAEVEVYPLSRRVRVRGIQTHGQAVEMATAGQRTALNLVGIDTAEVARGMVLADPDRFRSTTRLDAWLELLSSVRALKHRAPVHFHSGTAEIVAEIFFPDGHEKLEPGRGAYAQIRLRDPTLVLPGDRFILRQFSPVTTIGGGCVLDNLPPRHRSSEDPTPFLRVLHGGSRGQILLALLDRQEGGAEAVELLARTGWTDEELRETARQAQAEIVSESPLVLVHRERFTARLAAVVEETKRFHVANPLSPGITREELRERVFHDSHPRVLEAALTRLVLDEKLAVEGEVIKQAGRQILLKQDESQAKQQMAEAFERAGLAVPSVKEVLSRLPVDPARAQKILQILLKEGVLVRVTEDLVFHQTALHELRLRLAEFKTKSDRINVGAFKELTGITRKYAIPLLEYLDRERVTRRVGDERIIL